MLLVAPISRLRVTISSIYPTIAYIHQHLVKINIFKQNTVMIPHKHTYPISLIFFLFSLFLKPKYTAAGLLSGQYFPPSSLHYIIIKFSVFTNFNLNRLFSSTCQIFLLIFNKKYYNLTIYSNFLTPAINFE